MKSFAVIIFLFSTFYLSAQKADERIGKLIEAKDWFTLDEKFPLLKESVQSQGVRAWAEVLLDWQFNVLPGGIKHIDSLLANYQKECGNYLVDMIIVRSGMLFRMGHYGEAADGLQDMVEQLLKFVPKENLAPLIDNVDYFNKLRNVGALRANRPATDVELSITIEKITRGKGMFLPVKIHGKEYKFLFDTGSSRTCISQRLSDGMNLQIIMDSIAITGTMGKVTGKLAMLDTLHVGPVKFFNPLVFILPINKAADTLFRIDGIIGTDFMNLMGELRICPKEEKMVFPLVETPVPPTGRNMTLEGDLYYLKAYSGNKRLKIHFDTGNVESDLYDSTFASSKARKDTLRIGWIGGMEKKEVLRLDAVPFRLGDVDFQLKNVIVDSRAQTDEDGSWGMSFIENFQEVTLNFRKMFVYVKK